MDKRAMENVEMTNDKMKEVICAMQKGEFVPEGIKNDFYKKCIKIVEGVVKRKKYCFRIDWTEEDYVQNCMEWLIKSGIYSFDPQKAGFKTWFVHVCEKKYVYINSEYRENNYLKDGQERFVPFEVKNQDGDCENMLDHYGSSDSAEKIYTQKRAKRELMDLINLLPEKRRQVILLVDFQNYKVSEAAEILQCSPSIISNRLNRGHEALKKMMLKNHSSEDFIRDLAA